MRVPPDQSGTARATERTASSMRGARNWRVMRVSRVENRNSSTRRWRRVMAWAKCTRSRELHLPSTRSRRRTEQSGEAAIAGRAAGRRTMSPPVRSARRSARRSASRVPPSAASAANPVRSSRASAARAASGWRPRTRRSPWWTALPTSLHAGTSIASSPRLDAGGLGLGFEEAGSLAGAVRSAWPHPRAPSPPVPHRPGARTRRRRGRRPPGPPRRCTSRLRSRWNASSPAAKASAATTSSPVCTSRPSCRSSRSKPSSRASSASPAPPFMRPARPSVVARTQMGSARCARRARPQRLRAPSAPRRACPR